MAEIEMKHDEMDVVSTSNAPSQSAYQVLRTQPHTLKVVLAGCLGAALFGLDIGYFDQMRHMPSFLEMWNGNPNTALSDSDDTMLTALDKLIAAAAAMPFISNFIIDGLGRKWAIVLSAILFGTGQLLQATSDSQGQFYAGRVVIGLSIGWAITAVPLYTAETAPKETRGFLGGLFQMTLCFFMTMAATIAYLIRNNDNAFRTSLWYQVVFGYITAIIMFFMPETPRYLMFHDKDEEAEKVLFTLRKGAPKSHIRREIELMKEDVAVEKSYGKASYFDLLKGFPLRIMLVAMTTQFFQQWSGMNAFNYFGSTIYRLTGMDGKQLAIVALAVQFMSTIPSALIVDKVGRRVILIVGGIVMFTMMLLFGVLGQSIIKQPDSCFSVGTCDPATLLGTCPNGNDEYYLTKESAWAVTCPAKSDATADQLAQCAAGVATFPQNVINCVYSGDKPAIGTNPDVNKALGVVLFIGLYIYTFTFSATWGPVIWTYNAEIVPTKYRGLILGWAGFSNMFWNWVVVYTTPKMIDAIFFWTFIFFGCMILAGALFAVWLPETAGVPLEAVQAKFEKKFGVKLHEGQPDAPVADSKAEEEA